jgi:DNA-binding XRE family transcriptional regulator
LQCFGTLNQPEIKPKSQLRETDTFPLDYPAHNESNLLHESIPNTDLSIFGNQIKKARKANRESLRTMAKQLNISPSRLSQIENGCYPHPVNSEIKIQLLTYLGLEI